ncbi:SAM-dependent methyltransferase [Mycobacterium asiaticum]|uniref:SAM-dependent methyltransferase n=1 Tax=Mycobacterium asiaticum TaxID=1790 RepID=A0A1A3NPT9_MYCAS|nr:methyltransferase domain-containing protein [Mycobacterium asiaticum]OBK23079.1 SAM-dependent methyltransferase [Mycobacterium asiaticum]
MIDNQDRVELTRSLLTKDAELRHGYLDVLGESTAPSIPTIAQQAMNSPLVAAVYEGLWRPLSFFLASGVTTQAEERRAATALHLRGAKRLLDVACGPGNFTAPLAEQLSTGSLAVGFDISEPMLTRAVQDNSGPRTCYVRGDARELPFADDTFDAVACFGALYLIPEPFRVAREMIRVLRPGGRIALLTSYAGQPPPINFALQTTARVIGLTMFDGAAFVDLFTEAGLVDIEQQTQRALQFVTAAKPL